MPLLKVCGVNSASFAAEAAQLGIDYIGLIFHARSPRCTSIAGATDIIAAARRTSPGIIRFTGVFVEQSTDEILEIASKLGLDTIQIHRDADAFTVTTLKNKGFEVWKLYTGNSESERLADAVLLDGRRGTESRMADWSLVNKLKNDKLKVVLAGKISQDNIQEAIATGADIIDINSSIETAPGVKSAALLEKTLQAAGRSL